MGIFSNFLGGFVKEILISWGAYKIKASLCFAKSPRTSINSRQIKSKFCRVLQNHQKTSIDSRQTKSKLRRPKWDKKNIDNKDLVSTTNKNYNTC